MTRLGRGSALARMILHIFNGIGFDSLVAAVERGSITVRSSDLNHLAEIVTSCIKIVSRDLSVSFDFAEFTTVAVSYFGASCGVSDVIESMRKVYHVPGNDLLSLIKDTGHRAMLGDVLRKGGALKMIPSL